MANVTGPINTERKLSPYDWDDERVVKTGETIYKGQAVGEDANGQWVATGYLRVRGRAEDTVIAAPAGTKLKVAQGVFGWPVGSLTEANYDDPIYFSDNQTVTATSSGNIFGGRLHSIEDGKAWVLTERTQAVV